jgi:hypothetical protein
MSFWVGAVPIAIVAIIAWLVYSIVAMSQRHFERMERIKRGYPLDDDKSAPPRRDDYVDLTKN